MKFRHALCLLAISVAVVLLEPVVLSGSTPAVSGLAEADRANLYQQVIVVSAGLLGFFIAAVSILVSLDGTRKIVKELNTGEAFQLLVINMLVTIVLLFVLTIMGIVGAVAAYGADTSHAFEKCYEAIALASVFELVLSGFYFGVVVYKVAKYNSDDHSSTGTTGA